VCLTGAMADGLARHVAELRRDLPPPVVQLLISAGQEVVHRSLTRGARGMWWSREGI